MYRAVAKHVLEYKMPSLDIKAVGTKASLKSRILYRTMRAVTQIARMTEPSFMLWYNFLNWAYRRRVTHGFGRMIT